MYIIIIIIYYYKYSNYYFIFDIFVLQKLLFIYLDLVTVTFWVSQHTFGSTIISIYNTLFLNRHTLTRLFLVHHSKRVTIRFDIYQFYYIIYIAYYIIGLWHIWHKYKTRKTNFYISTDIDFFIIRFTKSRL